MREATRGDIAARRREAGVPHESVKITLESGDSLPNSLRSLYVSCLPWFTRSE